MAEEDRGVGVALERAGPCPVCGATERGATYENLADTLVGTPGAWSLRRCAGCGILMLDPRYAPRDISRAYAGYDFNVARPAAPAQPPRGLATIVPRAYLAHAYGYDDGLPAWKRRLALLAVPYPEGAEHVGFSVMYLPARPGGEVLDVGCGDGAFLDFARSLGWRVAGVDPDAGAAEIAVKRRGLDVRVGTLEDQRFVAGRFDAVTSSHVIEHVHDPLGFLRECARVTKPGGRIVVVTPNIESLGHRRFGPRWLGLDPPRHLHLFSCGSLARLAQRAGVRVIRVRSSARNAEFVWLIGKGLLSRWPAAGQRPPGGLAGRRARWFRRREWLLSLVGHEAGEEIVLEGEPQ